MTFREKLGAHWRRCRAIYIAGALLLALLNGMIYSTAGPRLSEEKHLRVLALDVELIADEGAILMEMQDLGYDMRELSIEHLPLSGNAYAEMLLTMRLVEGYVDLFVTNELGLEMLLQRDACLDIGEIADDDLVPIECQGAMNDTDATPVRYIGAMKKGEMLLVVPSNAQDEAASMRALQLVAAHIL